MSEKPDTRPDCVVTGNHNGQFRSVLLRGTKHRGEAHAYGEREGWTHIRVIQALAFAVGLCAGVVADRAQAGELTDNQAAIIGRIAVDAVAVQRCGFPQPADMFDGLQKAGLTIQDITAADGKFSAVMTVTMQHAWGRYIDHPAQFCAFVAGARGR